MIAGTDSTLARTLTQTSLNDDQRAAMFTLLDRHFEGVTFEQFTHDLAGKSHVILLERDERLVGFSTLVIYETVFNGEPVTVVYSGDTIVAPEAWNSPVLSRAWIATVNRLRIEYPHGCLYWLLLTSGFRTYRFLPVFWREFFPRFDQVTPARVQLLLDHLAREQFGPAYDPTLGLVRFTQPQRLRGDLAEPSPNRTTDPHVNFFVHRNPGHVNGDELVCLTELSDSNLTPAGKRMVSRPTG
jgi:Acetyltransferase (GNAT) domain